VNINRKYYLVGFMLFFSVVFAKGQVFQLDTTFQPFFDIREEFNYTSTLIEEDDGRIYVSGDFRKDYRRTPSSPLYSFRNNVCYNRDGSLFLPYQSLSSGLVVLIKLNDSTYFQKLDLGTGSMVDKYGNYINHDWSTKSIKSVRCGMAVPPLFFEDGSSIFVNSSDISGKPCKIVVPPDTFKGSHIIKLKPNGVWDSSFSATSNYPPSEFSHYDSNRIFVFGYPDRFTRYNGQPINGICRIDINNGELDTTFESPIDTNVIVGNSSTIVRPQLVEDDGGFFISGHFYLKDYPNHAFTLIRCHSDGSLDTSFNNFNGPSADTAIGQNIEYAGGRICPTDDGGYLVGGRYNHYQGYRKNSLAKIDSNGNLEPQYFTGEGPDSISPFVSLFAAATPFRSKFGGYYILGDFLKWDGKPSQPIVRIKEVTTSLEEKSQNTAEIEVYPNPSQAIFNVQSSLPIKQMMLFNLSGNQLNTINCISNCSINLRNYPSGVYLLRLILANGEMYHSKLIKH
jgi:hypothetical protein